MLRGRIHDRNLALIAAALEPRGIRVDEARVVGDGVSAIAEAVTAGISSGAGIVATTGGLGPTDDDLSMDGVAQALGRPLELNTEALELVSARNARVRATDAARRAAAVKQSTLPEGALVLPPIGTAPGAALRAPSGSWVVVLPGPPWELAAMLSRALERGPLRELGGEEAPPRVGRLFGVPESSFVETIRQVDPTVMAEVELGVCARDGELEVTLRGEGSDEVLAALRERYGDDLYDIDDRGLDELVARALAQRRETLATAESCTGGLLGARLTSRAGSSEIFRGGVVAYDNDVKRDALGVEAGLIERRGAVSPEVAEAMARGARSAMRADWGLSTTGVAGPGGGTPDKPVGLVYIACAGPDGEAVVEELRLGGTRERIRERSVALSLQLLRRALGGTAARLLGGKERGSGTP